MLYFSVWSLTEFFTEEKLYSHRIFIYLITLFHILNYLQFVLNIIHFF